MIRRHAHLTDKQDKGMNAIVKHNGLKFAENLRRAVDEYIDKYWKKKKVKK